MKLIFAGTPRFAAVALSALLSSRHEVRLVLTQPDRPSGRGLKPAPSPVKDLALAHHLQIAQPSSLKDPVVYSQLCTIGADLMVVAAYGLILPPGVLTIPRLGAINIHASLLPRWRGAAPIARALLAGDRETGVCIMQMDQGLDTGPVLRCEKLSILDDDDALVLHDRLAELGSRLVVAVIDALSTGGVSPTPQPGQGATYAPKLEKREARIDWNRSAEDIWRLIRALNPVPGACTFLAESQLKLWRAHPVPAQGPPGTILSAGPSGIIVACGSGALSVDELQRAGGRRLTAGEFLRGHAISPGMRLAS